MTTQEVAQRWVELCRQGQYGQAQDELYADNAKSVEPEGTDWGTAHGMDEIRKKGEQWNEMVEEVHGGEISDPVVAGNHFAASMKTDVTYKGMGRSDFEEVAVYEVQDGKIVKEQFFYPPPPTDN